MDQPKNTPPQAGSGNAKDEAQSTHARLSPMMIRIRATMAAAKHHGIDLDMRDLATEPGEDSPSPATLARWLNGQGLVAKGMRLKWRYLIRLYNSPPVVLMFKDGSAGLMVGVNPQKRVVFLRDPLGKETDQPVAVDEFRLRQAWTGDVLLVKRNRNLSEADAKINFAWLFKMVLRERASLRDIAIASMVISVLQIFPAFIVMQVVNRVIAFHSTATLISITGLLIVLCFYEVLISYARRELTAVLANRLDARISIHTYNRLLSLPLEFFERQQAGRIVGKVSQIYQVRDFITGRLLSTFLDLFTLVVILPFLFYISATLAWMTVAAAGAIGLLVVAFMPPLMKLYNKRIEAEMTRGSMMYETVAGIRTVKTLALEPARRQEWDEVIAEVSKWRLSTSRMQNWPETLVMPLDFFINRGVILIGAFIAISDPTSGVDAGSVVAFMMLGGRVAAPLVGLAKLMSSMLEVQTSLGQAGEILNNPTETKELTTGLRPKIIGALSFEGVNFTYPGGSNRALKDLTFSIPAGTMLGLVGRSGSGKSTITRLLQGVSRNYTGFLRLDGVDLREINLTHLRRSFGVVLQDNFLFRGTIRDNITAGRPGLTMDDVIRAARLAGAEEFIERMPAGYDTFIEEGSTNISGGQRQRLAIARAVILDPKFMILDEATSALDPESEALVNANLERIAKGRTMVIVSHRLSSLVNCDKILVLDQGVMQSIGNHEELLENCEIYRTLWLQQNRHTQAREQAKKDNSADDSLVPEGA
ncbi:peptidase domain-containing ABC transporter [Commensalibacter oyaizuii]|uniref:Peptidase domain-containing ABC transporter n=1 Tax=Commensalibacter oyaizuii TaxID=3043873 RepID=A0ABT6Q5N0_9PROT|nr:peptidase domain-containing ABC transporter [Commensalibacter sp. TBRC 16381]MDI2091769.1 peptidase domain-containing ABC transporter [Commensalibacter sp. TBRC 16381]